MDANGNDQMGAVNNVNMKKLYDEFDVEDVDEVGGKSELDLYLEAPLEKRDDESFDILKWWSLKSDTYKVLGMMAKDILAIPVSTVSSESAFSTSGRVLDQFRSSLGPKIVEVLICAQDWLRASDISVDIEQLLEDVEKYEEGYPATLTPRYKGWT
uniref:HAT C-terminal dimerisation domain-containing protein n=1 Tax=Chenopodium quinoa TaxID=63459 RepID=A0A803MDM3_CHEQI